MIFNALSTVNNIEYYLYMVRYFSNDAVTKFSLVLTTVELFELVLLMFVDEYVFCFISNLRLFLLFRLHVLALSLWATYALFIVSLFIFSARRAPLFYYHPYFPFVLPNQASCWTFVVDSFVHVLHFSLYINCFLIR